MTPSWLYLLPFVFLAIPTQAQLPLIPIPAKMERMEGSFPLSQSTFIQFPS